MRIARKIKARSEMLGSVIWKTVVTQVATVFFLLQPFTIHGIPASVARAGIFDPSITAGEHGEWVMSYSVVDPIAPFGLRLQQVATRLAVSRDFGARWDDAGAVPQAHRQRLPPPHADLTAVWDNEVSRIIYDRFAAPAKRWQIVWHRYLRAMAPGMPVSRAFFDHGWIARITAPSPHGPWSAEQKLFIGRGYDHGDDATTGAARYALDTLDPSLQSCVAFSEPGMLAQSGGLYIALTCATTLPADGRIILLRCDHALQSCAFQHTLIDNHEAAANGVDLDGFSAPDLIQTRRGVELVISPVRGDRYAGCWLVAVDLATGALHRDRAGRLMPDVRVSQSSTRFNGACGAMAGMRGGILIGEVAANGEHYRLWRSGIPVP